MRRFRGPWLALALLPVTAFGVDFTFEIPPVPAAVDIGGQHVTLTLSGELSASPETPDNRDQAFNLNLRLDLGDFQAHLTPFLQAELNKSEHCGDRVSIQNATLAPAAPRGNLAVQLHFEKWICIKALGQNNAKKLIGGDATVHVFLTPLIENSAAPGQIPGQTAPQTAPQTARLDADIDTIDADGPLGELLRSGSVGPALRDKIREALQKAVRKSTDLEGVMPSEAKHFVTIQTIAFADAGFGRLALDLAGRLTVPGEQVSSVLEQFGNRQSR